MKRESPLDIINRFLAELGWVVALVFVFISIAFAARVAAEAEAEVKKAHAQCQTHELKPLPAEKAPNKAAAAAPVIAVSRVNGALSLQLNGQPVALADLASRVNTDSARLEIQPNVAWAHIHPLFNALGNSGIATELPGLEVSP